MWGRGGSLAPVAVNITKLLRSPQPSLWRWHQLNVLTILAISVISSFMRKQWARQGDSSPDLWLASPPPPCLWLVSAGLSSAPGSWNVKIYARLAPSPGTRVGMLFYPALGGATRLIQTEISSKIWRITQTCYTVTSLHLRGHTSLATRRCGGLTFISIDSKI